MVLAQAQLMTAKALVVEPLFAHALIVCHFWAGLIDSATSDLGGVPDAMPG